MKMNGHVQASRNPGDCFQWQRHSQQPCDVPSILLSIVHWGFEVRLLLRHKIAQTVAWPLHLLTNEMLSRKVVEQVKQWYPDSTLFAAGWSLGGTDPGRIFSHCDGMDYVAEIPPYRHCAWLDNESLCVMQPTFWCVIWGRRVSGRPSMLPSASAIPSTWYETILPHNMQVDDPPP